MDEIIERGKFDSHLEFVLGRLANTMLELDFRRHFQMLGNVGIDEGDKPLLIEGVTELAQAWIPDGAIADTPLRGHGPLLRHRIKEIHVAADNGFRRRDKRFGIDETSRACCSEGQRAGLRSALVAPYFG